MAPKAVKTEKTVTKIEQPEISAKDEARFRTLFDERFYDEQTQQDLWATVINAGLKAIEKRRKGTKQAQLERAAAILSKHGVAVDLPKAS